MRISSQLAVRLGLVALLAGGIATIATRQNTIGRLRVEYQGLMEESQEAVRLSQENQEIPRLTAENQEVQKLREANQDLLSLRNEVRQLRRQVEGLESLKAENQRLATERNAANLSAHAVPPKDVLVRNALVDAGLETPEATVQTAFWAMSQGNLERLSQCMHYLYMEPNRERQLQELAKRMAYFSGFRINEKKILSADEVQLDLQTSIGGALVPVRLKLVANEWKIEGNL